MKTVGIIEILEQSMVMKWSGAIIRENMYPAETSVKTIADGLKSGSGDDSHSRFSFLWYRRV